MKTQIQLQTRRDDSEPWSVVNRAMLGGSLKEDQISRAAMKKFAMQWPQNYEPFFSHKFRVVEV